MMKKEKYSKKSVIKMPSAEETEEIDISEMYIFFGVLRLTE